MPDNPRVSSLDAAYHDGQNAPPNGVVPCPQSSWFRVCLIDEDGVPTAGEDFIVIDSAGARHEGKLDQNGEFVPFRPPFLPDSAQQWGNVHLDPRKRQR